MKRSLVLVPLAASFLALSAAAQTGRTMRLLAPVVIGQASGFVMDYPPSIAGNYFGFAMCSPTYPGALSVSVPGVIEGVLRLTPVAYSILVTGVLDASGESPAFMFTLPNDPLLVGATFDVQGADQDYFGLLTLTDNDLEVVVGPVAPAPPTSLNMVPIAPGTFQMGSPEPPGPIYYNQSSAQPVHVVAITQPFWMGRYEVTQAEYQALMGSNPSFHQGASYPSSASRPVEQIGWFDAVAFCDALTFQETVAGRLPSGYEYRLPTEAEWEYCCRAGTTTEWNFGNGFSCWQGNVWGCGVASTTVVGSYAANAWGLHDMHGNVGEWCLDSWDGSSSYPAGSVSDPFVTGGPFRVWRGGSWSQSSPASRAAFRWGAYPWSTSSSNGFRVVCAPILP